MELIGNEGQSCIWNQQNTEVKNMKREISGIQNQELLRLLVIPG